MLVSWPPDDEDPETILEDSPLVDLRTALLCAKRQLWDEEHFQDKLTRAAKEPTCGKDFYTSFLVASKERSKVLGQLTFRLETLIAEKEGLK